MSKIIYLVVGARPNFMKVAHLIHQLRKENINFQLIRTGQKCGITASNQFFTNIQSASE